MEEGIIKVLFIDDEKAHYDLLVTQLNRIEGIEYQVFWESNYQNALIMMLEEKYDVCLLDYYIDAYSGLTLLKEAIKKECTKPIIILTAYEDRKNDLETMEAGAVDFLVKSQLNPQNLERSIRHAINHNKTKVKLYESEKKYELAISGVKDGLWEWDLNNDQAFFSTRWKNLLGFDDNEITDNPDEWFNRVHHEDLEKLKIDIATHLQGLSKNLTNEHRIQKKNGEYIWVIVRGISSKNKSGHAYHLLGTMTDITERRSAQEQLKQVNELYQKLVNNIKEGVFIVHNFLIQFANQGLVDTTGYSIDELIGMEFNKLVATEDQHLALDLFEKNNPTHSRNNKELNLSFIRKDGISKSVVKITLSNIIYNYKESIYGLVKNVSSRKETNIAFDMESKYKTITNVSPVGIFITNEDGLCSYINNTWTELTGLTTKESYGEGWQKSIYYKDKDKVIYQWDESITKEIPFNLEFRIQKTEDNIIWVYGQDNIEKDQDGQIISHIGTIVDISKRKEMEEELLKTQSFNQSLIDSSLDMIIAVDKNRNIVEFNQAAQITFGFSKSEVIGKPASLLYYNNEEGGKIQERLQNEGLFEGEVINKRKDDSAFPAYLSASVLEDNHGNFIGFMGISRDITEKKQILDELKETQRYAQSLIDCSTDMIIAVNNNRKIIEFNHAAEQSLGYKKEELLHQDISVLYHNPEDGIRINADLKEKKQFTGEVFNKRKDGSIFPALLSAAVLLDNNGNSMGFMGISRDITDRKLMENALIESEERMQAILTSSPDVILLLDENFIIVDVFTARYDLLHLPKDEILGNNFIEILPKNIQHQVSHNLNKVLSSDAPIDFEYSITVNNIEKHFSVMASQVKKSKKHNLGKIILVVRDQTERKHILRLREDVERIVRHDLKSPLSGIIGFSEVLLDEPLEEKHREWLSFIHGASHQMLHMINFSLNMFKMEEGTYVLKPEEFDLIPVIERFKQEFSSFHKIRLVKIAFYLDDKKLDWSESYPIIGEKVLITSMLANLIKNALEASPKGNVVTFNISSDGDYHNISIHNYGIIPENIRNTFFERYTTSGKVGGTGIGTYSAMLIAKIHHGNISFSTNEETGTNLFVSLPKNYK